MFSANPSIVDTQLSYIPDRYETADETKELKQQIADDAAQAVENNAKLAELCNDTIQFTYRSDPKHFSTMWRWTFEYWFKDTIERICFGSAVFIIVLLVPFWGSLSFQENTSYSEYIIAALIVSMPFISWLIYEWTRRPWTCSQAIAEFRRTWRKELSFTAGLGSNAIYLSSGNGDAYAEDYWNIAKVEVTRFYGCYRVETTNSSHGVRTELPIFGKGDRETAEQLANFIKGRVADSQLVMDIDRRWTPSLLHLLRKQEEADRMRR